MCMFLYLTLTYAFAYKKSNLQNVIIAAEQLYLIGFFSLLSVGTRNWNCCKAAINSLFFKGTTLMIFDARAPSN